MVGKRLSILILAAALAAAGMSCKDRAETVADDPADWRAFTVAGVIVEIRPDKTSAIVRHEEIPDFMPAMAMPIAVKDPEELDGFEPGDAIRFRLIITDDDGWMDRLEKLDAPPEEASAGFSVRNVSRIEDLNIGDVLPDYSFVNERNEAVSLHDFHGKAVAMTFVFTSCPMPTVCPRMSLHFSAVQKELIESGEKGWHLLTVTIDPEVDTPERLRAYGNAYGADPRYWSFLTGDLAVITDLAEKLLMYFWSGQDSFLNHNLQTVVAGPDGRIRTILPGNDWSPGELAQEIRSAIGESANR